MKRSSLLITLLFIHLALNAGIVEKTYTFGQYSIQKSGIYQQFSFAGTKPSGFPGQPAIPWQQVSLMLPPGEEAVSVEIICQDEIRVPGKILLPPVQHVSPLSKGDSGTFVIDRNCYAGKDSYPGKTTGKLLNQYLNGFAFALTTFTPVSYKPLSQQLSYFGKVTVRITTRKSTLAERSLANLSVSEKALAGVIQLAHNPEMSSRYPSTKSPATSYDYLIVSPPAFISELLPIITMYALKGLNVRVVSTDSIGMVSAGSDTPEKIRNFIISQYQNHQIQYVLLAGNPALVPCRRLHCSVLSGTVYYDSIPSDLYYSGLDGTYDENGNHKYGELADSADLLPEISVGRFTVNDTAELRKMIRKTIAYQTNPVRGEFSKPLLAGEYLYPTPVTFGSDYMDLLIDDRSDNGYFTHGIPSATNQIMTLYDSVVTPPLNLWQWSSVMLLNRLNQGCSFIHHVGHANTTMMLRLNIASITNQNFSQVNGVIHNFQLLYTQGCDDGAFDKVCIAAKAVMIDNWLVAGIFNSRYGWFNQGTTDGPSQHLEREFVSALYNDTTPEKHIGTAHTISKIKTAPWISLPGEFEPGAQRWCHFGCNLFGDPALEVWTEEPSAFIEAVWTGAIDSDWQKPGNWNCGMVPGSVFNVTIPETAHNPVVSSTIINACNNLTLSSNAVMSINPGKSLIVYGTVFLSGD